jgi:uncharacterized protein (DUF1800 family)
MALDSTSAKRARIAFQRFGLGPKPGGPERIGGDAKGALLEELDRPNSALISSATLPSYRKACAVSQRDFDVSYEVFHQERRARAKQALKPEIGLLERLVTFWSNHFSMTIWKGQAILGTIGQLERDVIRPNILGSFSKMLLGVMRHPAMIAYLDNDDSIGPRSPIGKAWGAGFNENLAREILELHTVGVGGGYTEGDVTNFARIITGWSYVRGWEADNRWNGGTPENRGQFIFRADWHEPGGIELMGKRYSAGGIEQGEAALRDLAVHPKTAEHLAFKLILHFLTDEPTEAMVNPLATAFLESGGDLGAMTRALVELPAAWSLPLKKIRTPYELAIAQFRATGTDFPAPDDEWAFTEPLRALDNLPWEYGPPDGFPDESAAWLNPDAMRVRLDTALLFVDMFGREGWPAAGDLAPALFDAALSQPSKAALGKPPDERGAMTVLLMLPEFQRR